MKKVLIIHHSVDNDGVLSAALVKYLMLKYSFKSNDEEIAFEFKGMNYDNNPSLKRKDVKALSQRYNYLVVTDFSLPPKTMDYCLTLFGEHFLWFDHHKTAIDESMKYNYCKSNGMRSTDKSAIMLAWCYFEDPFLNDYNGKVNIPLLLEYLSAWDSWTYDYFGFSSDNCQEVNIAFTSKFHLDIETIYRNIGNIINKSNSQFVYELMNQGNSLLDYENYRVKHEITKNGDATWLLENGNEKRKTICVYLNGATNSKMFSNYIGTDIKNALVIRPNLKEKWSVSLYNINPDDTFHCGEYLKSKYKGAGGHLGAAGASFKVSEINKILKAKKI